MDDFERGRKQGENNVYTPPKPIRGQFDELVSGRHSGEDKRDEERKDYDAGWEVGHKNR